MNTLEIIHKWLSDNGYQGLCGEDCGCDLDDLAPCGEACNECVAGYWWYCKKCEQDDCEYRDFYGNDLAGCYRADL